jgi:hypothetical protein
MVMRKFFTALVLIPLGLVFVIFAVANRHLVAVSFDPFNSIDPSADARQVRAQLADLRAHAASRGDPQRLPALTQGGGYGAGGYGAGGRDKQGATL